MGLKSTLQRIVKAVSFRTVDTNNAGAFFEWMTKGGAWGRRQLIEQYGKNGYVYASISAIAEKVGNIDFYAEKMGITSGKYKRIATHPAISLLQNPNPQMSSFDLFELSEIYLKSSGEFVWYTPLGVDTGIPKGIYTLRPDLVEVAIDEKTGDVTGYTYQNPTNTSERETFDINEIVHIKKPNPMNPYRGLSAIEAAKLYIETDNASTEYTSNFLKNQAQPAGIVSFAGTISNEEFAKIKRQWQERYGGVDNAGKMAFVKGLTPGFTKIGLGLDEINMQALKDMTRDDIMAIFRVSKPILGIFQDVNLASAKTAHYVFMKEVIDPEDGRIIDGLNKIFMPRFDDPLVRLNYTCPVPQDEEEKTNRLNLLTDKIYTRNEARAELGLPPVAGGDELYVPISSVAISDVATTEPTTPPAAKGFHIIRRTIKKKSALTTIIK